AGGGCGGVGGWNGERLFSFKQKTAYDIGLGITAEPLFRSQEEESEGILQSPAYHKRKPQRSDEHERSEERFSRNAETDLVCRLLLEKKKKQPTTLSVCPRKHTRHQAIPPSPPHNRRPTQPLRLRHG